MTQRYTTPTASIASLTGSSLLAASSETAPAPAIESIAIIDENF